MPPAARHRGGTGVWRRVCALGLLAAATLAWVTVASAQAAPATRVAYVDMKRLIDSSPQFLRARERLLRDFEASSNLLREDEARVAALEARLRDAQQAADLEAERALLAELEPLRRSVERTRDRLLRELESRSEQEVERAWPLINDAVAEYAREQGFDLVLSSGVTYASGRADITDRVLDRLQRAASTESGR